MSLEFRSKIAQAAHIDVHANCDEFEAAFELRVAHFVLYDCVRFLVIVKICDEESISEPQEIIGAF